METTEQEFNLCDDFDGIEGIAHFNRANTSRRDELIQCKINLNSFQDESRFENFPHAKSMEISLTWDKEKLSGLIDDIKITLEGYNNTTQIFELEEMDPEQLFWAGDAMIRIAEYFGLNRKEIYRLEEEHLKEYRKKHPET